jgi:prepilin-type N-terminal cleavage/methylation domain-containing protein
MIYTLKQKGIQGKGSLPKTGGFTLVETLMTIFIFGIIMLGTTLMLRGFFINNRQQTVALNNIDQARRIANTFMNELRNSSYGVGGAYPVGEASDTQIVFYSTAPLGNGTVSRVRYYISSGILYKGITNPSGNPLVYNLGTETVKTLLTSMSLGVNPLFYYYDGNYNGSTNPLTQQVNINSVKFVKMNLIVLSQSVQSGTTTFTVSGGAALRNLKTNLGN